MTRPSTRKAADGHTHHLGTDVHGHDNVVGATFFPHNIGLGATNNESLRREISRITALETAATVLPGHSLRRWLLPETTDGDALMKAC